MTSTTIQTQTATPGAEPRAAKIIGAFAARFYRGAARMFTMNAEHHSCLRAAQEMSRVARHYKQTQPNLAGELDAIARRCEGLLDVQR